MTADVEPEAAPQPGAAVNPFAPAGVVFTPISSGLITARLITLAVWVGLPFLVLAALAVIFSPWWWIGAGVFGVAGLWAGLLIPRQVRATGYAERDEDLLIRKGILFRQLTVVPYGRMQYVDVQAGPLARRCGIAGVQLHTASAATDASIPGLPPAEADRLRDRLTERGEARLAGL
ncbi:PH domain-containing protein [Georgenia wangjunii]|uniref:PH domain-containing protein n=1 Tax=Georgenia wangjunii TaxID=3117730 RepID=UPI002F265741